MHNIHLEEMVKSLVKQGIVAPGLHAKAMRVLASQWDFKKAFVWDAGDVHTAANKAGRALTDNDAQAILERAHLEHDAQVGMSWSVLEGCIAGRGREMTEDEIDEFVATAEPVKA